LPLTTKLLLFKVDYGKEPRIGFKIRKKKHVKVEEFVKKMKEIHEKVKAVLKNHRRK